MRDWRHPKRKALGDVVTPTGRDVVSRVRCERFCARGQRRDRAVGFLVESPDAKNAPGGHDDRRGHVTRLNAAVHAERHR